MQDLDLMAFNNQCEWLEDELREKHIIKTHKENKNFIKKILSFIKQKIHNLFVSK